MIPWSYQGKPVDIPPENAKAFVYLLELQDSSGNIQKYIGKKNLHSIRRKKVIGKTRRVITKSESDWKKYLSSSKEVKNRLKTGDKLTVREILRWCDTIGEGSYWEAYYQFQQHVLLGADWLNKWISVRVYRQKLKDTE